MKAIVVRVTPWLAAQQVLGEPVPAWWARVGAAVGARVVVSTDPDEEGGDLVIDGACLGLGADVLGPALEQGRALCVASAWGRVGHVVAAPAAHAALVGSEGHVDGAWPLDGATGRPLNDAASLRAFEDRLCAELRAMAESRGVRFVGGGGAPAIVGPGVSLAPGCVLWPDVVLLGRTQVHAGAVIYPGCHLFDTVVGACTLVKSHSVCEGAVLGDGVVVGPFAHLRAGSVLEDGSKVGNFVELKQTRLGRGAKANHLAYLGDAEVGADANIGAGTITCNYDGANKHRTHIGDAAFVGTNTSLVAPLHIGDGALIAAGSVVTEDVPEGALALGRARQTTLEGRGARILAANRQRKAGGDGSDG